MNWEKLHEEQDQGFDIVLSIAPEDIDPADLFDTSIDTDTGEPVYDIDEIYRKINNGTYSWFVARVKAYKHGIELGCEYLGGNLYADPNEFIADGCFADLKWQALEEAKNAIQLLTEGAE